MTGGVIKSKIRTVLVGLGSIGSQNDQGKISQFPLSHVGALFQNPAFELIAAVDPDPARQKTFRLDWPGNVPLLSSIDDVLIPPEFDLLIVASPTNTHFPILYKVLTQKKLKAVFCEKPFCSVLNETQQIFHEAEMQGIPIVVNYQRRWDSKIAGFRQEMWSYGTPIDVQVVYNKGLYNYGSHIIDLMVSIWGSVVSVRADGLKSPELYEEDPSLSVTLEFQSGFCGRLNGCDEVNYDLCDMDVSFQNCRFHLEAGGYRIIKFDGVLDLHFPGYCHLRESESGYANGPVHGLNKAYEEIGVYLQGGAIPTTSTGNNALHVAEVLDAIRRSAEDGGRVIKL